MHAQKLKMLSFFYSTQYISKVIIKSIFCLQTRCKYFRYFYRYDYYVTFQLNNIGFYLDFIEYIFLLSLCEVRETLWYMHMHRNQGKQKQRYKLLNLLVSAVFEFRPQNGT